MSASNGTAAQSRLDGRQAAVKATERNSIRVAVPVIGTVTLPPPQQLAFVGGVAALTALEVIEWPVAVALVAGHVLTARSHNKVVRDFGEALEEALSALSRRARGRVSDCQARDKRRRAGGAHVRRNGQHRDYAP